jgi:hypothetical protein
MSQGARFSLFNSHADAHTPPFCSSPSAIFPRRGLFRFSTVDVDVSLDLLVQYMACVVHE